MARSIDERIVDMQFNNRQFEEGVKETLTSLDKLKTGLDIDSSGGQFNLAGLVTGVEKVSQGFNALGTIAFTALQNITNKAIDAGEALIKSLTIDPLVSGFNKYETMVKSVQTIMNATGLGIEAVSDQMDILRVFTDETSFSLSDMTTNIGKFTGVGIELETAVTAMQGIGNYAALSGLSIEQTSSAMGVFAKAVGQGAMQLKEWKQLENMNAATVEFKQVLLDTAVAAGTLQKTDTGEYVAQWADKVSGKTKEAGVSVADFTSVLTSSGWLSKEVMLSAMDEYGRASTIVMKLMDTQDILASDAIKIVEDLSKAIVEQGVDSEESRKIMEKFGLTIDDVGESTLELGLKAFKAAQEAKTWTDALDSVKDAVSTGWAKSFEYIFGNYEEAKELWTEVAGIMYDLFAEGGNVRNEILSEWKDLGGRDSWIQALYNAFEALNTVLATIGAALDSVFPPMTGQRLFNLTEVVRLFTERLILGDEGIDKLQRTFAGLFSILGIVKDAFGVLFDAFGQILGIFSPVGEGFTGLLANIGDFLVGLRESGIVTDILRAGLSRLVDAIVWVKDRVVAAFTAIVGAVSSAASLLDNKFKELTGVSIGEAFIIGIEKISDAISWLIENVPAGLSKVVTTVKDMMSGIDSIFKQFTGLTLVEGLLYAFDKVSEAIAWVVGKVKDGVSTIIDFFKGFGSINVGSASLVPEGLVEKFNVFTIAANIFKGAMELIKNIWDFIWPYFQQIAGSLGGTLKEILSGIFDFANMLSSFSINTFIQIIEGLIGLIPVAVKKIGEGFILLLQVIVDALPLIMDAMTKIIRGITVVLTDLAPDIAKAVVVLLDSILTILADYSPSIVDKGFSILITLLNGLKDHIGQITDTILDIIITFVSSIINKIKEFASTTGLGDILATLFPPAVLTTILFTVKNFLDTLSSAIANPSKLVEGFSDVLDGVSGALEAFQMKLKVDALLKIAVSLGVLAAALWVIAGIPTEQLLPALGGITVLFLELTGVMLVLSKAMGPIKLQGVAVAMIEISVAILILAQAFKQMATLSYDDIGKGIVVITVLMAELAGFTKLVSGSKLNTVGIALVEVAAAILILTQAMKQMADLSWEDLAKGLVGVGALLLELGVFTKLVDSKGLLATGTAMIPLATGILILSQSVKQLAGLTWEELAKGLLGLAGGLAAIVVATKIVNPGEMLAMGVSMLGVSTGLLVMAEAMKSMAQMSWEELGKGLVGLAGSLLLIVAATKIMDPVELLVMAASLVAVGAGLVIIAGAMEAFGSMSWEEVAKSLIMLAGSLTILAAASKVIGVSGLGGAAAILVMAAALLVLTPSLVILGNMPLENIGASLLMIAGVFTIFGVAGLLLGPISPILIALGIALTLLGVGLVGIGAGLLLASAAMTAFAIAGDAGVKALVSVIEAILGLIPMAIEKIGEGFILLLKLIADSMPLIVEAVTQIVRGIIQVLTDLAPELVVTVVTFVGMLLTTLAEHVPKFVESGFALLIGMLKGIRDNIQEVVVVAIEIIANFLDGLAAGIPEIATSGMDLIVAFIKAIGVETPRLIDAGFQLVIDFVNGTADAIRENVGPLIEAAYNLGSAILEGLVDGLFAAVKGIGTTIVNIGSSIVDGFKSFFEIKSPSKLFREAIGHNLGDGLAAGIDDKVPTVNKSSKNMADESYTSIKESKLLKDTTLGQQVGKNFAVGLDEMTPIVSKSSTDMADKSYKSIESSPLIKDKTLGSKVGENLAEGIDEGAPEATKAAEDLGDKTTKSLKERLYDATIGKMIPQSIADGIDEGTPEVVRAATDMSGMTFEAATGWIDEYKTSTDYLITEELKMWESMQNDYKLSSDERVEIDTNITKLKKIILAEQFADEKLHIEKLRELRSISQEEEISMWEDLQIKYKKGTDERRQIEEELARLQVNTINDVSSAQNTAHANEQSNVDKTSAKKSAAAKEEKKTNEEIAAEKMKALDEEIAALEKLLDTYDKGTKDRIDVEIKIENAKREQLKLTADARAQAYEVDKRYIEERLKLTNASIQEEIAMWKEAAVAYDELSSERIEINKRIADLELQDIENQRKARESILGEQFAQEAINLERRRDLQKMTIDEEIAAWTELGAQYDEISRERVATDLEVNRLQQQQLEESANTRKQNYDIEMRYIEAIRKERGLSIAEELEMYKDAYDKMDEYSQERLDIKVKIGELEKQQMKINADEQYVMQTKLNQDRLAADKQYVEDHLTIYRFSADQENELLASITGVASEEIQNRLKLARFAVDEELKYWEESRDNYAEGSLAQLEVDVKIGELKKKQLAYNLAEEIANNTATYQSKVDYANQTLALDEELGVKQKQLLERQAGEKVRFQEAQYNVDKTNLKRSLELQEASIGDQIKAWKKLAEQQDENSRERIDAEIEISDLKKKLLDEESAERERQYQIEKTYIEKKKKQTGMSIKEEIAMWEEAKDKFSEFSKEREEISNTIFALETKSITDRRRMQQISLGEELVEWQTLQAKYAEGTDQRLAAENGMIDAIIAHRQLGNISLEEEYQAWATIQGMFAEGTEQRVRAEEGLLDVKKRAAEEQKKLQEEIEKLEKDYADAVESRAQQLASAFGLFAEVKEQEAVAAKDLIKNLEDQVTALSSWASDIKKIAQRGVDEGLLEELKKMGPGAAAEIKALANATDGEFTRFNNTYKEKIKIATSIAESEFSSLKKTTDDKISDLKESIKSLDFTDADAKKLSESGAKAAGSFVDGFTNKVEETATEIPEAVDKGLKTNAEDYKILGEQYGNDFAKGIDSTKETASLAGTTITRSAEDAITTGIKTILPLGVQGGLDFAEGLKRTRSTVKDEGEYIVRAGIEGMKAVVNEFYDIGLNAGDAFARGIQSKIAAAVSAAVSTAKSATEGMESELEIQSPSKVMYKIGQFTGQGFVDGLVYMSRKISDPARSLGKNAIDVLRNSLSDISDIISGDMDLNPTITPVLNLSDIQNGTQALQKMLEGVDSNIVVDRNIRGIVALTRGETTERSVADEKRREENATYQFTQNNYSPKALSRLELYRQTQNQFAQLKGVTQGQ